MYAFAQLLQLRIPMHADCGDLRYPGFFYARKQIDHAEFAHKTGLFGNKIFIYYIHLLVYRFLPKQPLLGPKLFFILYNLLSASVLWATIKAGLPGQPALFSVFIFLLLTGYHRFYTCFDSIEKYALLPVLCLCYLVCTTPQHYHWWIGLSGPLLFFFFKPTFIFEWAVAASFAVFQVPWGIIGIIGGILGGVGLAVLLSYSRFGKDLWDFRGLIQPDSGLYLYWLRYRNHGKGTTTEKNTASTPGKKAVRSKTDRLSKNLKMFVMPALPGILLLLATLVVNAVTPPTPHKFFFTAIFLASTTGLLMQFRFYPYQFLPLIPGAVLAASSLQHPPAGDALTAFPIYALIFFMVSQQTIFLLKTTENKATALLGALPHYLNRCLAAPRLAALLPSQKDDWLLVWGDSPQVNLYAGLPSPVGNENPTAWNWTLFKGKMEQAIATIQATKPRFVIPTIDNINWITFEKTTGLRYACLAKIKIHDEFFAIYQLVDSFPPDNTAVLAKDYFLPCRQISTDGRHVWNGDSESPLAS